MAVADRGRSQGHLRRYALPSASALAAGLCLSRLWCEAQPGATPWAALAAALAAGIGAGALAVWLLLRLRLPVWPLLVAGAYALAPLPSPRLALAAGLIAAVTFAALATTRRLPVGAVREPPLRALLDLSIGGAFLALYVATLAPSVQPADAGEFQLVAAVLGIAHPPGYPLYTILGKAFTLLPLGDPAWRVNLFAAVCAATTLAVVSRAVRRATGSAVAGVIAAVALGLVPTFWSQATVANVRSLTALFTALAMHWLLRYGEGRAQRYLVAFAATFSLGATHHSSIVLLALPFAAYLLAVDPRLALQPRRWAAPLAALAAPLLVLAYLPLRSAMNPPFDSPSVRTLSGLVTHVLALGFQGDFLYFLGQPTLGLRAGILADILRIELGWALATLAVMLGLYAACRRRAWALLWGGVVAVNAFAAITYRAPQTVEYLLPAYVALAIGLGLGLGTLLTSAPSPQGEGAGLRGVAAPLLAGLIAWLALAQGLAAYPGYLALHRDNSAREQAVALLEAAPEGALILANWHKATPLWYLQQVEGMRRDVTVTYVYPEGATPNGEVWARRMREAAPSRPVIVTNRYAEFAGLPFRLEPLGEAWLVRGGPARLDLTGLAGSPVELGGQLLFLGARIGTRDVAPGGEVSVEVAWRPARPLDRDYSWFVHLVGPQGIAGQQDLTYRPDQVSGGEAQVDAYRFTLRPNATPGEYRLIAGAYITFPDGKWQRLPAAGGGDTIELGTIRVRPRAEPPATTRPLALAWSDGSRLVGVDYDDSVPGQRRVYLHWYRPAGAAELELNLLRGAQPVGQARAVGGREAGYQTVACDVPPGGTLSLAVTAQGRPLAALGPWHLPISRPVPLPNRAQGARYLDLGGEMVLTGIRWRPQVPAAGSPLDAELQLLSARALTADYSLSLSLEGAGWHAQHDGTPALGAIPTLKWLPGWQVRDLRLLDIPATASGPARLRLSAYDAFSLEPLAVGDDRLAQAGQGTEVTLWEGTLK